MDPTRIYIDSQLDCEARVELSDSASRHIKTVLRMKPGQKIHVFNGSGGYFVAQITTMDKRTVTVVPLEHIAEERESNLNITLVQGISRGQRMDYTVQKAVELGVKKIVPLVTEFSNVNLDRNRVQNKLKHWRSIIISACEQCRRTRIPEISEPVPFMDWVRLDACSMKIIFVPGSGKKIKELNPSGPDFSLLSGSEGGFSETEISCADSLGYCAIGLGPRILRTETAAITAISSIQAIWGDIG